MTIMVYNTLVVDWDGGIFSVVIRLMVEIDAKSAGKYGEFN